MKSKQMTAVGKEFISCGQDRNWPLDNGLQEILNGPPLQSMHN
jgi:hypothetical protein